MGLLDRIKRVGGVEPRVGDKQRDGFVELRKAVNSVSPEFTEILVHLNTLGNKQINFDIPLDNGDMVSTRDLLEKAAGIINNTEEISPYDSNELLNLVITAIDSNKSLREMNKLALKNSFFRLIEDPSIVLNAS